MSARESSQVHGFWQIAMTIERDDPEEHVRSGDGAETLRPLPERDRRLCRWAARMTGASLIRDGIPAAVVEAIVHDAYLQYARFRKSVRNPRALLVKRIMARADAYKELRGIEAPASRQTAAPDLLALIRMQAGLEGLTENARQALQILFEDDTRTYADVAEELGVTVLYAETLVAKALAQLRRWRSQKWPEEQG
jgi:DNA-directed RNA polymerase specialized sigma24 family protein